MSDLVIKREDNDIYKAFSDREPKLETMLAMKYFEEVKDRLFIDSHSTSTYLYNGEYLEQYSAYMVKRDIIDWFRYMYDESIFIKMSIDDFNKIFNNLECILEKVDISTVIHILDVDSQIIYTKEIINTKDGYFDLNKNELISCERDSISPCPFKYIITDPINEIRRINDELSDKLLSYLKDNEIWIDGEISLLKFYDDIKNYY